jgi:hypothetical protein
LNKVARNRRSDSDTVGGNKNGGAGKVGKQAIGQISCLNGDGKRAARAMDEYLKAH